MKTELVVTGVILAGGKSSRMGRDKGLIPLKDKPMIRYGLEALSTLTKSVVISTDNSDYRQFGYPLVSDQIRHIGPMGGLHAVLQAVSTPYILALSVDMPFISSTILQQLVQYCNTGMDAIVARFLAKIEPLCGVYSVSIHPVISEQIKAGDYSLQHLLQRIRTKYVDFDTNRLEVNPFLNINTPDELKTLND